MAPGSALHSPPPLCYNQFNRTVRGVVPPNRRERPMADYYTKYIKETFDPQGRLVSYTYDYADNFNYGYDVIDELARLYPERLAMLWQNDRGQETRLTFSDLSRLSSQIANLFAANGLRRGDTVMAVLRTHWEYWVVAIAAHKAGLLLAPVYYRLTQSDFAYRMEKARVRAVVACPDGDALPNLRGAARTAGDPILWSIGGQAEGFRDFHREREDQPETMVRVETAVRDPMILYFTSGTTGQPKGVLHDFAYPLANHCGSMYMQGTHEGSLHFATGDTGWEVVSGTKFYCQWLHLGALFVYDYDRFPPEKVLRALSENRVTGVMAQPTVYRKLTDVGMDRYDLSAVDCYAVGGEKLPADLGETVYRQTGFRLNEGYAQSEAGLIAACSVNMGRREGSVGRILPKYHVEILADDGSFAPAGQMGEIVIVADGGRRPEGLMMGYLDDEEANAGLWDGNLFHTGDLAVRDEDGFLYYRGRADGMIKTKGYRVSPVEIESALSLHPAVYECMAVGEPDRALGQRVKVYVRLTADYLPSEALKTELMAFHNDRCAGYKKIRALEFVDAFARNANGKLIRDQFDRR